MKITHIHIERFRGFQNEDFEVGSQLTAIAGQNGTQKSTLLGIVTQTFTLKPEDPIFLHSKISLDYRPFLIDLKVMNGPFLLI